MANGMTKITGSGVYPEGHIPEMRLIEDPERFEKAAAATGAIFDYEALRPDDDHVGIHLVGIGDVERYGFNRNADGFPKEANQKFHPTFVKYGMVYRHHKNKDRNANLGLIKASAYNEKMGRIELFIHANKERAEKELEKFASDGEIPFSMACRVQYDRCSICDQKRRTSKDPDQCDHVRYELGKMASDGRYTGVYNDEPKHFDMSFVIRPADRIAWSLSKAASANGDFIDSASLAEMEGIWTPQELLLTSRDSLDKLATARKLASFERKYRAIAESGPQDAEERFLWELRKAAASRTFTDKEIDRLRQFEPADVFYTMAANKMVMDPVSYVKYAMGVDGGSLGDCLEDIEKEAADIYTKMINDGSIYEACTEGRYDVEPAKMFGVRRDLVDLVKTAAMTSSMDMNVSGRRAVDATLTGMPVKIRQEAELEKTAEAVAKVVAREYATYKLASTHAMQALNSDVDDRHLALVAAQNMVVK